MSDEHYFTSGAGRAAAEEGSKWKRKCQLVEGPLVRFRRQEKMTFLSSKSVSHGAYLSVYIGAENQHLIYIYMYVYILYIYILPP